MATVTSVADRIRELRTERRLSQEQLGQRCGVSGRVVWTWEANRTPIPADELPRIADALEVSLPQLFGLGGEPSLRSRIDRLTSEIGRAIELSPDRVEINIHVSAQPAEDKPLPGLRFAQRVLQDWPSMTDEERQGWQELADAIKSEGPDR